MDEPEVLETSVSSETFSVHEDDEVEEEGREAVLDRDGSPGLELSVARLRCTAMSESETDSPRLVDGGVATLEGGVSLSAEDMPCSLSCEGL